MFGQLRLRTIQERRADVRKRFPRSHPKRDIQGVMLAAENRPLVHHGPPLAGLVLCVDDDDVDLGCEAAFAATETGS
jgi:hypothetical protein